MKAEVSSFLKSLDLREDFLKQAQIKILTYFVEIHIEDANLLKTCQLKPNVDHLYDFHMISTASNQDVLAFFVVILCFIEHKSAGEKYMSRRRGLQSKNKKIRKNFLILW